MGVSKDYNDGILAAMKPFKEHNATYNSHVDASRTQLILNITKCLIQLQKIRQGKSQTRNIHAEERISVQPPGFMGGFKFRGYYRTKSDFQFRFAEQNL